MKALIVYDSTYGNTAKIARTIAKAMQPIHSVIAIEAKDATQAYIKSAELLVVGSPTHGGGPTPEILALLDNLPQKSLQSKKVAAFDTRLALNAHGFWLKQLMRIIGFAAPKISSHLVAKGGKLISKPMGFIVEEKEGPLREGELEKAAEWVRGF